MAFSGYLIKVGNYTIPLTAMKYESYQVIYSTVDMDSYRDANGQLHREALSHKVPKVEFNTPYMSNNELTPILNAIQTNYVNAKEKKALVTFYVPELNDYRSEFMYIPDIQFTIRNIDGNTVNYGETRLAFIGY